MIYLSNTCTLGDSLIILLSIYLSQHQKETYIVPQETLTHYCYYIKSQNDGTAICKYYWVSGCTSGSWWLSLQAAVQRARDRSSSSSHTHTSLTSRAHSSRSAPAPCTRGRISEPTAALTAALSTHTLTPHHQIWTKYWDPPTLSPRPLTPRPSMLYCPAAQLSIKQLSFTVASALIYGVLNCILAQLNDVRKKGAERKCARSAVQREGDSIIMSIQ